MSPFAFVKSYNIGEIRFGWRTRLTLFLSTEYILVSFFLLPNPGYSNALYSLINTKLDKQIFCLLEHHNKPKESLQKITITLKALSTQVK